MESNDTVAPVVLVLCRVTPAGDHVTDGHGLLDQVRRKPRTGVQL
jgi:hypothetical protein